MRYIYTVNINDKSGKVYEAEYVIEEHPDIIVPLKDITIQFHHDPHMMEFEPLMRVFRPDVPEVVYYFEEFQVDSKKDAWVAEWLGWLQGAGWKFDAGIGAPGG